jgi:hypothetical protein
VPVWGIRSGGVMALAATSLLVWAADASAISSAQIAAVINAERHANGLPPVREDPALSTGCAEYDNYRRLNGSVENAFTLHGEETSKRGYTAAGARAARHSLLNAGDRPADSFAAGDVFDDAPNHLVALMDPAVAVIGADQTDFDLGLFGTVSLSCIDVRSAPPRAKPRRIHVYTYVGPGGKAPRHPAYREGPHGHGAFVFLYFDAPRNARVTLRSLTIGHHGSVSKPAFVAVSGGMVDGRRGGRSAISNSVAKTPTPTVQVRDDEESEAAEAEFEDFLHWKAEEAIKGFHRAIALVGAPPIPFK